MKIFGILTGFLFALISISQAQATIMVPDKLVIESNQRTGSITLMNPDDKATYLYTFEWGDMIMREDGNRKRAKTEEDYPEGFQSPSKFIRFSPRRIVLRPKQRQQVRFLVRRSQDMPEGELRGHFYALPQTPPNIDKPLSEEEQKEPESSSMQVMFLIGKGIPIYVRNGELEADIKLTKVERRTEFRKDKNVYEDRVYYTMTRTGNIGGHGIMEAHCHNKGQKTSLSKFIQPFYKEIETLNSYLVLSELPEGGCEKMTLTYSGDGSENFFGTDLITSIDVDTQ